MALNCQHKRTCESCREQFNDAVKAAYKLGLLDGEVYSIKTINTLTITNKHLMEEVLRRDKKEPREGDPNFITIRFKITVLKKLITALRKSKKPHNASLLSNELKRRNEEMGDQAEKILNHLGLK